MTITLISEELYQELLSIQQRFPVLTYQNRGYDEIDRSVFTEEEQKADARAGEILKGCIEDFRRFQNFKLRAKGEIAVRFQYVWDKALNPTSFTGVGYLLLTELRDGFLKKEDTEEVQIRP